MFQWAVKACVRATLEHQGSVMAVAWSPEGTRVATASADHTARVWDARSGQPVSSPLNHQDSVVAVAWSPDSTRVATASWDRTARVWDARSGQPLSPPLEHQGAVDAVAWSPDGTRVATASADKTARIWDASWDTGSLDDWCAVLPRCGYVLTGDGVLAHDSGSAWARTQRRCAFVPAASLPR